VSALWVYFWWGFLCGSVLFACIGAAAIWLIFEPFSKMFNGFLRGMGR
jgi:hypothetical protein